MLLRGETPIAYITENYFLFMTMATVESISELKQLIIGIDGKVGILSNKLDNIEDRFTRIVTEIKSEVDEVKTDVINTKLEVQKLREDHLELEKGLGHIELEINRVADKKLNIFRTSLEKKILFCMNNRFC